MRYLIGVGSNRGDRKAWIHQAADRLNDKDVCLLQQATFLDNPAQGGPSGQDRFLNTAWLIETELGPHQLLHRLQRIETALGRVRTVFHGARSIDLDILLCDQFPVIENVVLTLPHPAMLERIFVMEPVSRIAPDWQHPIAQQSLLALKRELDG